jgi:hypothetical protein
MLLTDARDAALRALEGGAVLFAAAAYLAHPGFASPIAA